MTSQQFDYIVVGGGPAAVIEASRLVKGGARAAVISNDFGGSMRNLANQRMQSYVHELEISDSRRDIRAYIADQGRHNPTGWEYAAYVRDTLYDLPLRHLHGKVSGIEKLGRHFVLEIDTADGQRSIRAGSVVLSTGLESREPGPWAPPGATATCFEVYDDIAHNRFARYAGRTLAIIGSGNTAFQLAFVLAGTAASITILAKSYLGMFPQETDCRFALRAMSQPTLELIAKTSRADGYGPANSRGLQRLAPIWLHIYRHLDRDPDSGALVACLGRLDNIDKVSRISFDHARRIGRLETLSTANDEHRLKLPGNDLLVISAIGVKSHVPELAWSGLINQETGFVDHEGGQTAVAGLYVAGACAGYPSVNTMVPSVILDHHKRIRPVSVVAKRGRGPL